MNAFSAYRVDNGKCGWLDRLILAFNSWLGILRRSSRLLVADMLFALLPPSPWDLSINGYSRVTAYSVSPPCTASGSAPLEPFQPDARNFVGLPEE